MKRKILSLLLILFSLSTLILSAEEPGKSSEINKPEWKPLKIAILEFSSADIKGQKFLTSGNPVKIPAQETLNAADRKSVNSVMQGFVRMIDAWDSSKTGDANRVHQTIDNQREWEKAKALYQTIVKGESRPMLLGADYLSAYLGRNGNLIQILDSKSVEAVMLQLKNEPDFPNDAFLKLARKTGATHLISATVSDIRSKENTFKGYGIETKNTVYNLDVILKLFDLITQRTVYSNVYSGSYLQKQIPGSSEVEKNLYQKLMESALKSAAEDIVAKAAPGPGNKIAVSLMPWKVTVNPAGGIFFKPQNASVSIDGIRGAAGAAFTVPEGRHTVTVAAPGYKTQTFSVDVKNDTVLTPRLEK